MFMPIIPMVVPMGPSQNGPTFLHGTATFQRRPKIDQWLWIKMDQKPIVSW